MDQPDTAPKKLVMDSSDALFESVINQRRNPVPMPAEIPNPEKPSRFGLNRSEPVDMGKLWTARPDAPPKLAIEVSPGVSLGLTFESGASSKSDPHQQLLGEQTRGKSTLFGGAGLILQRKF
jgi:hypothetical protein